MPNKKLIIGIATGVALIAAAGLLIARRNKSAHNCLSDKAGDLTDAYRHKLSGLQKKARREFDDMVSHGEEVGDRVNSLVKKVSSSF